MLKMESASLHTEDVLNSLVELSPIGVGFSRDGVVISANQVYLKMFGYADANEIRNLSLLNMIAPQCRPDIVARIKKRAQGLLVEDTYETIGLRKDNTEFPIFISAKRVDTLDGPLTLAYIIDITEQKRNEIKFRTLFETNRDAVMLLDDHGFFDCNEETLKIFGCSTKAEFCTKHPADLSPPQQPSGGNSFILANDHIVLALAQGNHRFDWVHRRADTGMDFPAEVLLSTLELDGRKALQASVRDISARKHAEENLSIIASVFDNSQEGILISDADNRIINVNPAFTTITGYSREEVLGQNPKLLSSGRQPKAFYTEMWQSIHKTKNWRGEVWDKRKSGEIYAAQISISAICGDTEKVLRYVSVFSDITHIKNHEAELSRIAHYDALTGIPNRVLLADRMKQAIAQTGREHRLLSICYLDLDGFKPINDLMGHEAGDQVLIEVAKRIGNTIRGGDTVARLGGDEFVVLLLGQEKGEESVATLERMLASISQPIVVNGKTYSLSASIGVSMYPLDDEDPDMLLRHADQAMYIAKQSGKNRFHIYDPSMDKRAREQHEFLKYIKYGLENNQFELFYQPKIDLRSKYLVGAEALIRWRHPTRGLLAPVDFLRQVENTDLDIKIGEWVTATALAQMNRWHKEGFDIEISINISGYHMESPYFVEHLKQQLDLYPDIYKGRFQIEVLETVALNDISVVRKIIEACREIGVGFALDDFGTGYSSLAYLSKLPVDVLKIDQSFVRDMLEDKGDMAIVHGIIALARAFDRQTVAEGIETEAHYLALLEMGCELGQGFRIARPMPADELTHWRMT
jgi:diguanylate cyclase (GGDEF)-like protein/PAS domain S-box-containing protein